MDKDEIVSEYADLALSMHCVEIALKKGWNEKALKFASAALIQVDKVSPKLNEEKEISLVELNRRMLDLK